MKLFEVYQKIPGVISVYTISGTFSGYWQRHPHFSVTEHNHAFSYDMKQLLTFANPDQPQQQTASTKTIALIRKVDVQEEVGPRLGLRQLHAFTRNINWYEAFPESFDVVPMTHVAGLFCALRPGDFHKGRITRIVVPAAPRGGFAIKYDPTTGVSGVYLLKENIFPGRMKDNENAVAFVLKGIDR